MKRIIPHTVINIALLSFAFGQSAIAQESGSSTSEQEVRQAIEKYRTALLRRDIPALEQIWTDDYFFVMRPERCSPKRSAWRTLNLARLLWDRSTKRKILKYGFIKTRLWGRAV